MSISTQLQRNTPSNLAYIWAQEIDESLASFNQVDFDCAAALTACYPYSQRTREQVETAMIAAYEFITDKLGYYPVLTYGFEDMQVRGNGRRLRNHLRRGKVHALGKSTIALLQADASVVYSKSDAGLAYNDEATITIASTIDPRDLIVRFKSSDCPFEFPSDDDARLDIKPLVTLSDGATITIKGSAALFAKPTLQHDESIEKIDATDANNFVTQVNLYERTIDYDTPAELFTYAEARKSPGAATALTTLTYTELLDSTTGLIELPSFTQGGERTVARVYFESGKESRQGEIEPALAKALTAYASTLIPPNPHDVSEQAYRNWSYYRQEQDVLDMVTGRQKAMIGELEALRTLQPYIVRQWGAS